MTSKISCPIAAHASNAPALITDSETLSYAKLNQLIEHKRGELPHHSSHSIPLSGDCTVTTIILIFALLRQGLSPHLCRPKHLKNPIAVPFPCLLLNTAGSSGIPKTAVLTPENFLSSACTACPALNLTNKSCTLLSLPLYHVGGLSQLFRSFHAGASVVLTGRPLAQALCHFPITHASLVPTQLYRLLQSPFYPPPLESLLIGGAPLPSLLLEKALEEGLPVHTSYGMTEMASLVALDGYPLPHCSLCLDPSGEIFVRGTSLFHGYVGELINRSDWFPTKDLGKWVENRLMILGRKDNLFISGGENIQPEEIERALLLHPNILEAVVVPKEDPEWGARPVAFIHPFVSLNNLSEHLFSTLERHQHPIAIYPLPPAFSLKRSRNDLKGIANTL